MAQIAFSFGHWADVADGVQNWGEGGEHPGEGPNVVLMAMCNDDCLDLVLPLGQKADVRQDLGHAKVLEAAEEGFRGEITSLSRSV